MSLTDAAVRNAKPKEKPYKLADGHGLYLLIHPNGSKYWRYKYYYLGKEKVLALGLYPDVPLSEARDKHYNVRKQLTGGSDPASVRKEDKRKAIYNAGNTFESVAKEWFETNKPKWVADHADRLWRRVELHMMPLIGDRPIADISSLELLDALRKVEKRGTTETSHRLLQTVSAVFRYAVLTARTKYNPSLDLKGALVPHKAANHPTIQAKELPDFFKKLEEVDTTRLNKLAVRLLMLAFIRQGELRQAKWEDVDLDAKEWRLPAHTTKMRDLHIVPLAKQTIKLFKELEALTGKDELLFPSQQRRRNPMMSENTINHVLHKMGYKDKLVGHGFRALASTTLNEMGYPPDVIERQLAHAERNKIRAAYNRAEYLPQRREMMQKWADFLETQRAASVRK